VAMSKFDSTSPMPYEKLLKNLEIVKARLQRPLTLSEKILYSHLDDPHNQGELCTKSISALVLTRFLELKSLKLRSRKISYGVIQCLPDHLTFDPSVPQ
jgi:hypothetical protein